MPAIVGVVNLNSVGSASVFHIGDVYTIAPISTAKTYAGAGSFNTGDGLYVVNQQSSTNTSDNDVNDQNVAGNL
ncbi:MULTISPECIES: spore germination protein [Priestia]|uniref:Spore germination protein n=2 Tax=Priestia TaxID=2800373 RepID=A0AAX6BEJ6_PRIMG|nr:MULTISPECIES: spore germination protein [Priestia]MBK0291735.1 spore germination protein [Bacillus sp. S34]UPK49495.1 spore germination protein [Bacillus sp. H8-1]AWD65588.1 spore germination protein [Priestia megaterium]MBY0210518.1 spore germination protein [Priestia aryabhattai]MDC7762531.1 spore germination protein [Priestia aryabhattai]